MAVNYCNLRAMRDNLWQRYCSVWMDVSFARDEVKYAEAGIQNVGGTGWLAECKEWLAELERKEVDMRNSYHQAEEALAALETDDEAEDATAATLATADVAATLAA